MLVFLLLIKQPDFSAILITFPVVLIMLFASGASLFHLFIILGYAFISALFPILWSVITLTPELLDNALVNYFFHLSDSWLSASVFMASVIFGSWLLWRLSVRLYANVSGVYFAGPPSDLGFFSASGRTIGIPAEELFPRKPALATTAAGA